eukprot:1138229-Pelagomonas_calceolata.AAC.3
MTSNGAQRGLRTHAQRTRVSCCQHVQVRSSWEHRECKAATPAHDDANSGAKWCDLQGNKSRISDSIAMSLPCQRPKGNRSLPPKTKCKQV